MFEFNIIASILVVLCLVAGVVRIWLGPGKVNRLLAAQLFGSMSVTITILLASVLNLESLIDLAIVLSLLASIAVIAFIKLADSQNHD